ncbi:MAG TPA: hypothetical protein VK492_07385 [Chitinophagaceae bacterium]|nr:hypothetical protein [Chitinophagaceae bacterium]
MSKVNRLFITAIATFLLCTLGFTLFHFELVGLGYTFFIVVPLCIGYSLGIKLDWGISLVIAVMMGLTLFFFLLLTAGFEGLICVIMLLPIFIPIVLIGILIGYNLRKRSLKTEKKNIIKISLYPLIVLLFSGGIEHFFSNKFENAKVESTIYLPYKASTVYDFIKSVDTLAGKRSLLMNLGLSVPQKCVLEKEEVGAKRTCYFENGTIEEKVTDIKRGKFIKMKVTDYKLPGFKWLKFDDAIYLFTQEGDSTKLTRITTYQSQLKPRIYWEFWEKQAIEAQHEYVLNDLKRRLEAKHK